ncbi:GSCFA domain-containing protein [Flavobacterium sp.]|uniref:GSCFA domain-containing protein n=1 Tax=Flavobacterium sp. TaxID=239 RepID=UPI00261CA12D|nr:GSCFA domain-containing protein [Flavobacterium sp.]MDG2433438.1 GSCFA domain-containing protein [Flavobacterium sp.]
MQFRTQIPIPKSSYPIDYNSKVVSLGSCFAENMASKLQYFQFQNFCNPFGIIFNPVSIEKLASRVVANKYFTDEDVFFYNERWHCFEIHSDLSSTDKVAFLECINQLVDSTKEYVMQASHIIITLGTAWVYRCNASNEIVANCHKVPQKEFTKELLSIATIQETISNTIRLIQSINPSSCFIFSISPVRHSKDGFVQNQLGKSHLISALQAVLDSKDQNLIYFPSYEIMMDELRDYRFYNEDMLHPSTVAIDYIWERFVQTTIADEVNETMKEVATIQRSLQHRSFNPQSESHQKFEANLQSKISKITSLYSHMKF